MVQPEENTGRPGGDSRPIGAHSALTDEVYEALLTLAAAYLRGDGARQSMTPSVLVHEAWLKLARGAGTRWNGPEHFKATAARAIRQILIDRARSARARHERVTVSSSMFSAPDTELDLEALDQALERLNELDSRGARVVEMRFFGGMTQAEIAEELRVSVRAVQEDWAFAHSWLLREMSHERR